MLGIVLEGRDLFVALYRCTCHGHHSLFTSLPPRGLGLVGAISHTCGLLCWPFLVPFLGAPCRIHPLASGPPEWTLLSPTGLQPPLALVPPCSGEPGSHTSTCNEHSSNSQQPHWRSVVPSSAPQTAGPRPPPVTGDSPTSRTPVADAVRPLKQLGGDASHVQKKKTGSQSNTTHKNQLERD